MIVSSQLFEAYLECPTKCWLRSRAEPATANYYAEWARSQNETYLEYGLKRLLVSFPKSDRATAPPIPKNPKDVTWRLAIDVRWRTSDLESCLQAVERISSRGQQQPALSSSPIVSNSPTKLRRNTNCCSRSMRFCCLKCLDAR